MKEKFLIVSDLQLKEERLEDQLLVLNSIKQELETKKYKGFIVAGDLFDDRKNISSLFLKEFTNFLYDILLFVEKVFLIAGNHDKPYDDALYSYFRPYARWDKVEVIEDNIFIAYKNILFIPFLKEEVILKELKRIRVQNLMNRNIEYIITHLGISGIPVDSGKVLRNKLTVKIFKRTFPKLKKILSGHYHTRKSYKNGFVYYFGNPIALSHNEEQVKGIHELSTDGKIKFIPLNNLPQYKTYKFKCNVEDYEEAKRVLKEESDNYIRFIFFDDKEKLTTVPKDELSKLANKYKLRKLKIKLDFPEKTQDEVSKEIVFNEDIFDLFEEYSKNESLTNRERKFGKKILERIING